MGMGNRADIPEDALWRHSRSNPRYLRASRSRRISVPRSLSEARSRLVSGLEDFRGFLKSSAESLGYWVALVGIASDLFQLFY